MDKDLAWALALVLLGWGYISLARDLGRKTRELERVLLAIAKKLDVRLPYIPAPPSERVRELAQDPKQRVEAIRAYRQETGADVKEAIAAIDHLRGQSAS